MKNQDADNCLVDHLIIPNPCTVGWDHMSGNDEVRFCKGCETNVYNLSAVSKKRGSELFSSKTARCVRMGRRADGTLVTDECPRWFKPVRRGWKVLAKIAVSIVTLLVVLPAAQAKDRSQQTKKAQSRTQQKAEPLTATPLTDATVKSEAEKINTETSQSQSRTTSVTATDENKPKDQNIFYAEGTVIDPRHYVSGRDERHQKTSPLLPIGLPGPENK